MDEVPEYACRVKGDGESWGRVLSMQGYGNAGSAPRTTGYRANSAGADGDDGDQLWRAFSTGRPYVASSPSAEAAARIVSNREAIVKDAMARKLGRWAHHRPAALARFVCNISVSHTCVSLTACRTGNAAKEPFESKEMDLGLRAVASALVSGSTSSLGGDARALGGALASHLVGRMCVPRDMGQPAGFTLRELARELGADELGDAANSAIRKYD